MRTTAQQFRFLLLADSVRAAMQVRKGIMQKAAQVSDEAVVVKTSECLSVFMSCDRRVRSLMEARGPHVRRIFPVGRTRRLVSRSRAPGGARAGENGWSEPWLMSWQRQARG